MNEYISSGVFTVIERLRMVTLRNFVKRVAEAIKADKELQVNQNPNHIDLNLLFIPLKKWDEELDLDDL